MEDLLATTAHGEDRPAGKIVGVSIALHVLFLVAIVVLATRATPPAQPERIDVVFFARDELAPPPLEPPAPESPPAAPVPARKVAPAPQPPAEAPVRIERSAPEPPRPAVARTEPPPKPRVEPTPTTRPEPPRPKVRTNLFEQAEAVAEAAPRSRLRARGNATVGSFQVAAPPEPVERREPEDRTVVQANFGATPAASEPRNGSGERRAVTTAGFGGAAAGDPPSGPTRKSGSVQPGSFGQAVEAPRPRPRREKPTPNPDTPVEILSKPKPLYTAQARELRVEGEVVLEVTFVASGRLRVLGVVESLGHGLDEAAIEAAEKIQFTPAKRDGRAIDYTAVLRIVFQLV